MLVQYVVPAICAGLAFALVLVAPHAFKIWIVPVLPKLKGLGQVLFFLAVVVLGFWVLFFGPETSAECVARKAEKIRKEIGPNYNLQHIAQGECDYERHEGVFARFKH